MCVWAQQLVKLVHQLSFHWVWRSEIRGKRTHTNTCNTNTQKHTGVSGGNWIVSYLSLIPDKHNEPISSSCRRLSIIIITSRLMTWLLAEVPDWKHTHTLTQFSVSQATPPRYSSTTHIVSIDSFVMLVNFYSFCVCFCMLVLQAPLVRKEKEKEQAGWL